MELLCEFSCFVLVFQEANMEECVFWWRWVDRQPAEPINMGLDLSWAMFDGKVVLLQRCRPAAEECRPSPHRF